MLGSSDPVLFGYFEEGGSYFTYFLPGEPVDAEFEVSGESGLNTYNASLL